MLLLFAAALSKYHGRSDHAAKASAKQLGEKNGAKMPEIRCYRNALDHTLTDRHFGVLLGLCERLQVVDSKQDVIIAQL